MLAHPAVAFWLDRSPQRQTKGAKRGWFAREGAGTDLGGSGLGCGVHY